MLDLPSNVIDIAKKEASLQGLRIDLVLAIICTESGGNTKAIRYEKGFGATYKVDENAKKIRISSGSELVSQKISWGLMQIMGGIARWRGYEGYLTDLLQPELGIKWGCVHLKAICDEYLKLEDQISIYNWGHLEKINGGDYPNPEYVSKVLSFLSSDTNASN